MGWVQKAPMPWPSVATLPKPPTSSANTAAKEGDVESRWQLNQPTPPPEHRRVVVQGQRLKVLENGL